MILKPCSTMTNANNVPNTCPSVSSAVVDAHISKMPAAVPCSSATQMMSINDAFSLLGAVNSLLDGHQ